MTAELPYAGTSGWSGTDTSKERANQADSSGVTSDRQYDTLLAAKTMREKGITVTELCDISGWHHGTASGVLSVLHLAGKLDRLVEKRNRCHIYVLPVFTSDRDTQQHGRINKVTIAAEEYNRLLEIESNQMSEPISIDPTTLEDFITLGVAMGKDELKYETLNYEAGRMCDAAGRDAYATALQDILDRKRTPEEAFDVLAQGWHFDAGDCKENLMQALVHAGYGTTTEVEQGTNWEMNEAGQRLIARWEKHFNLSN